MAAGIDGEGRLRYDQNTRDEPSKPQRPPAIIAGDAGPQPLLVGTAANYGMNSAVTSGRYQSDTAPLGRILVIRSLTSLVKSQASRMTNQRPTTGVASGLFGQQRIPIGNPLLPVHPFQLPLTVHRLLLGHGV
jgi:hypothetical protein